jgi:hypothetical protein
MPNEFDGRYLVYNEPKITRDFAVGGEKISYEDGETTKKPRGQNGDLGKDLEVFSQTVLSDMLELLRNVGLNTGKDMTLSVLHKSSITSAIKKNLGSDAYFSRLNVLDFTYFLDTIRYSLSRNINKSVNTGIDDGASNSDSDLQSNKILYDLYANLFGSIPKENIDAQVFAIDIIVLLFNLSFFIAPTFIIKNSGVLKTALVVLQNTATTNTAITVDYSEVPAKFISFVKSRFPNSLGSYFTRSEDLLSSAMNMDEALPYLTSEYKAEEYITHKHHMISLAYNTAVNGDYGLIEYAHSAGDKQVLYKGALDISKDKESFERFLRSLPNNERDQQNLVTNIDAYILALSESFSNSSARVFSKQGLIFKQFSKESVDYFKKLNELFQTNGLLTGGYALKLGIYMLALVAIATAVLFLSEEILTLTQLEFLLVPVREINTWLRAMLIPLLEFGRLL